MTFQGTAHIVAKPRIYLRNRPNIEGPEDGDDEEGGAEQAKGEAEKGEGGKGGRRRHPPPHP